MFSFEPTYIDGVIRIKPSPHKDLRGEFVKIYHEELYNHFGIQSTFAEEYYSTSKKGVIRGLHFQRPPMDHNKLVYCVAGKVLDVVLDLRKSSASYGHVASFELQPFSEFLFLPKGIAHGFYSLEDNSIMVYKVSTVYAADLDDGILWNSIDFEWPIEDPILSERDKKFSRLSDFQSPFN
jgi:dTDP-4-dehydrorhamnose 3,5-epimerase